MHDAAALQHQVLVVDLGLKHPTILLGLSLRNYTFTKQNCIRCSEHCTNFELYIPLTLVLARARTLLSR
jgi:hypothetical protein